MNTGNKQKRMLRYTAVSAAWSIILLGATLSSILLCRAVWPGSLWPSFTLYMKFNTALAFIGCGIGLIAALRESRRYTFLAGCFVLFIGGITLLEYFTGLQLGFDEWLVKGIHSTGNPYPGRMTPTSALAFTCAGLQLLSVSFTSRYARAMQGLGFLVSALVLVGLMGYSHRALAQATLRQIWRDFCTTTTALNQLIVKKRALKRLRQRWREPAYIL